jgi:hypothetical protein
MYTQSATNVPPTVQNFLIAAMLLGDSDIVN